MTYTTLSQHYRRKFGCKVYKLALDAGFTCPNRDGTVGSRGCIFCSRYGGGEFAQGQETSLSAQLAKAKEKVAFKVKNGKFIAYFQSFSNTYGHPDHLRKLYLRKIKHHRFYRKRHREYVRDMQARIFFQCLRL